MKRLWLQLTLGFALVILVTIVTISLLAHGWAETTFRSYVAQNQVVESGLISRLAEHYAAQGSWAGAGALLEQAHTPGRGMGRGPGGMAHTSLALADATGRVIADPDGIIGRATLSAPERATALPIALDEQTIGFVLAHSTRAAILPAAAQRFLDTLNNTLWVAGGMAGIVGLALGLIIARSLAAPLQRLAIGARQIAAGRRDVRVPSGGPVEVATVAGAFNEMAAALEAGEAQRRTMVADIAHELRTPLTVVQGNLQAILDDVYPLNKAEIATVYTATQGLRRLVDDLRELSLAEADRLELRRQVVAITPLLQHAASLFADLAAAQGVTLHVEADPALPPVYIDRDRIAQVFQNLIGNALRYTPASGAITLRATATSAGPATQLHCEVIDTGAGIAAADLPHVFERFYRVERGRARDSGGSGLGLAIARQIVRLHGGTIGVTSAPDAGARFWFTLPLSPDDNWPIG
jgi:two-component system OmpR family sensor kinase/two-component system sensor histidine kinase BaeS